MRCPSSRLWPLHSFRCFYFSAITLAREGIAIALKSCYNGQSFGSSTTDSAKKRFIHRYILIISVTIWSQSDHRFTEKRHKVKAPQIWAENLSAEKWRCFGSKTQRRFIWVCSRYSMYGRMKQEAKSFSNEIWEQTDNNNTQKSLGAIRVRHPPPPHPRVMGRQNRSKCNASVRRQS